MPFPRARLPLLNDLAVRVLDRRKPKTPSDAIARELLAGFHDICLRAGLDGVLTELAGVDAADPSSLYDHATLRPALVAQLDAANLDGGSPRNQKPRQVVDALVAGLGVIVADVEDRTITLDGSVRADVVAAMTRVVEQELAVPQIRDSIIATARKEIPEAYRRAFDAIAAQLDDRGMRLMRQPNVPLDASQAVQRELTDARAALFDRVAKTALDRAREIIAKASPEAAARIDAPVSQQLTPRDVAVLRVSDPLVPKVPAAIVDALIATLTEVASIGFRAAERPVRTYAASQTFAAGELIDHPKFGKGEVLSVDGARFVAEFASGKYTLVHVRPSK